MDGIDRKIPGRSSTPPKTSWFEFILDTSLLEKHLSKEDAEPSPTELIIQFLANAAIPYNRESSSLPPMIAGLGETKIDTIDLTFAENKSNGIERKKTKALKVLALKVTAWLNWNLEILEDKLPLPMQNTVLFDFLKLTIDEDKMLDPKQHASLEIDSLPNQAIFALLLYHRWVIRAIMLNNFPTKPSKTIAVQLPGQQIPTVVPPAAMESIMTMLNETWEESIIVLERLCAFNRDILMLSSDSFDIHYWLKENVEHKWNVGSHLTSTEFQCQVSYDLGCFYFFREEYKKAGEKLFKVNEVLPTLGEPKFCKIDKEDLEGYLIASSSLLNRPLENHVQSLEERLQVCISNKYEGLIPILIEDNKTREISKTYRLFVERQIQQDSFANPRLKKLYSQVCACNAVRTVLDEDAVTSLFTHYLTTCKFQELDYLLEFLGVAARDGNMKEKELIKNFIRFVSICCNKNASILLPKYNLTSIFSKEELEKLSTDLMKVPDPPPLEDRRNQPAANPTLLIGELERLLLETYDPEEIRQVLQQLHSLNARKPLWKLNSKWELPSPILNLILNSTSGLMQDYIYILVAKARQLTSLKSFSEARLLIDMADREVGNFAIKLSRLIRWESVFVDLLQTQAKPSSLDISIVELSKKCKTCITALQQDLDVLPRTEIIEHCCAFLLTSQSWDFLASMDGSRNHHLEFSAILARACMEIRASEGSRKAAKELWETILPIFSNYGNQQKRSGLLSNVMQRESVHSIMSRTALNQFMEKVQNPTPLSVMISCLGKLHNIIKDDSNNNLHIEYATPWPSVVSNVSAFYIKTVCESLSGIVQHAVKLHPSHPSFLKTIADLNYVLGYHSKCLRYYLEAGAVTSNFFNQPVPRSVFDDQVYKRLIRCCSQLSCHTQAAVLCQFLDETDYTTAFKALQEKNCTDSMDAYYSCIWDITILEFLINLHTKRGEVDKKQIAIKVMGQMELNSNNNEEIKREAALVRKRRFLRALSEQML